MAALLHTSLARCVRTSKDSADDKSSTTVALSIPAKQNQKVFPSLFNPFTNFLQLIRPGKSGLEKQRSKLESFWSPWHVEKILNKIREMVSFELSKETEKDVFSCFHERGTKKKFRVPMKNRTSDL